MFHSLLYTSTLLGTLLANVKLLKQLESGFKRKINWNKCKYEKAN